MLCKDQRNSYIHCSKAQGRDRKCLQYSLAFGSSQTKLIGKKQGVNTNLNPQVIPCQYSDSTQKVLLSDILYLISCQTSTLSNI